MTLLHEATYGHPELSDLQSPLWSLIFAGCEDTRSGGLPRHIVTANVIRTLEGGIVLWIRAQVLRSRRRLAIAALSRPS